MWSWGSFREMNRDPTGGAVGSIELGASSLAAAIVVCAAALCVIHAFSGRSDHRAACTYKMAIVRLVACSWEVCLANVEPRTIPPGSALDARLCGPRDLGGVPRGFCFGPSPEGRERLHAWPAALP